MTGNLMAGGELAKSRRFLRTMPQGQRTAGMKTTTRRPPCLAVWPRSRPTPMVHLPKR
jgi:hypothetical protein